MSDFERAEVRRERISRRISDLGVRIGELRTRRGELSGLPRRGSSADQLSRARGSELAAQAQLADSLTGAVRALRQSAAAHDRAAAVHENLAASGVGDVGWHRSRAADHRAGSLLDQLTADEAAGRSIPDSA